jgi:uncharacterized alkaline shock family protein YloU
MRVFSPERPEIPTTSDLIAERFSDRHSQFIAGRGETIIADTIVAKIVSLAVREIRGVHILPGPRSRGWLSAIAGTRGQDADEPVRVKIGNREVAVHVRIAVDHGRSIPDLADAIRRSVVDRVQSATGLTVKEVHIDVADLYFPDGEPGDGDEIPA